MASTAAVAASWHPACDAAHPAGATIAGSATYRERVALSPDAVFMATLEDMSRADAASGAIAQVRKVAPGQVPIAFEIPYDPRRIDARRKYVVRASVYEDGRLRFTGSQAYSGPTRGSGGRVTILMRQTPGVAAQEQGANPGERWPARGILPATFTGLLPCADCVGIRYQVNLLPGGAYMQRMTYLRDKQDISAYELGVWALSADGRTVTLDGGREGATSWALKGSRTLRLLDRTGNSIDSELPYDLSRLPVFEAMEPRLQLLGMFRYLADAPLFRDCHSELQWPVAMSDDYRALEHAYRARHTPPGSELLVVLDGRIEQRPKVDGPGTAPTLVVERFVRAIPGQTCEGREEGEGRPAPAGIERRAARPGIENTRWRPIRIGDQTVSVSGQNEPWIELEPRTQRFTGSGGCNRITGSYQAGEDTLRFGRMMATQMACPSIGAERAFLRALGQTRRYRVSGRMLELLDDRGRLLARLEERNLR